MKKPNSHTIIISLFILSPVLSIATDTITPTKPLTSNQTLVSSSQVFELGFFDPGNGNWYLGIWYKQIQPLTCVWVGNRNTPVDSSSCKLTIGENGDIILLNQAETAVWTSNQSVPAVNTVAQLLDSGNFVLRSENDENPENYIWESFNNPTDTLLPGMKLGWDRKTGVIRFMRSWKSGSDPGSGNYSFKMNIDGFPEVFLLSESKTLYRSGPWNGKRFSGVPEMKGVSIIEFEFENNHDEISYSFEMMNSLVYSRLIVSYSGLLQRFTWVESVQTWNQYWFAPRDQCDAYRKCGPGGVCDANASLLCKCMKGFRPKNQQAWDLRDGSNGCVRSSEMDCGSDGFMIMKNMKLPESSKGFVDQTLSLNQCVEICKRNCSCGAYANTDITGTGSGCVIWAVDLLDMRQYADSEGGQDLFVRAAASDSGFIGSDDKGVGGSGDNGCQRVRNFFNSLIEFPHRNSNVEFEISFLPDQWPTVQTSENGSGNNVVKVVSITVGICAVIMILLILFYLWRKKMQRSKNSNIDRKGWVRLIIESRPGGYMSPEYAMDGIFSIKSDVFSFGVLVLEIVSGKKNRGFYHASNQLNLIGHIWSLWKEGNAIELIDESIGAKFLQDEVLRCIQIGLLCVREQAEDRPNMSKVLLMLSSDTINLPQPKYPGFGLGKRGSEKGSSSKQDESLNLNELTVTMLDGR
ncbi:hypothetical protein L1987_68142 [Smallanthus sonchifolius]|uniref:Uncharacterized protein n=1 Tax=Smallanthus sonchifolius TaxID=185202 RepID=A0ACB9B3H6_9ASTR|nr:hypothetical protein L1987_68142 [Smallanthus sonchifolius]